MDIESSTVIKTPFNLDAVYTNEGVPGVFKTLRRETLAQFYLLLFPSQELQRNVLFIKAPPFSGKTGFAQLFCQLLGQDPKRSVVFLSGQEMKIGTEDFSSFFGRIVGYSLDRFLDRPEERVMILDEAQCTYSDERFWKVIVKQALNGSRFSGLRIVLLSSFGSFNPHRISVRDGTPIAIPKENNFGLYSSPGLNLQFAEFQEMATGSAYEAYLEMIWKICSRHIGVASTVLKYLDSNLRSLGTISVNQVQSVLYSKGLLQTLAHDRGMPTFYSFTKLVAANGELSEEEVAKMKDTLHSVAMGEIVQLPDETESPGETKAVELLVKCGFLFEDEKSVLSFASQMHLKVWLNSTRKDCVGWLDSISLFDFIALAIGRMHSARLSKFHQQNSGDAVCERQVQMEMYAAIVSLCPKNVYVTPEWRTSDKKGYIDLVVQFPNNQNQNTMWFLELLVDGVGAKEHSGRFKDAGKYQSSLGFNSQYALIDFRQNVAVRDIKDEFTYVCFSSSFEEAMLKSAPNCKTVKLLS
jgi:hypothetical protein